MAIFGPKPWVNPFRKISIFRHSQLFLFFAQKGVFSFYNIIKDIILAYIAQKKKVEIWPFLDQNHGLTLWKNVHFSIFETSCFYSLERRFFVLEYDKRHFPGLYCLKKKIGKISIFGPKPSVNPFRKMSIFDCLNFLFLQPREAFFRSIIS